MDRVPRGWWLLLLALGYDLSPIDLVPDAVPLLGLADDLGVTGLALLTVLTWWRRKRALAAPPPPDADA